MSEVKPLDQRKELLPPIVRNSILKSGLVIVGGPDVGKSNAGKVVMSELIKTNPVPLQCKIYDTAMNFRFDFDAIKCQLINEQTRYVYGGNEHIIFDLDFIEEQDVFSFIEKVILNDYITQRKRKSELGGHVDKWYVNLIEEAQNLLGTFSLMRREGRKLLKLMSESRNFGITYLLIGQRLAEMSTRAIERRHTYLFGRMTGDNDIAKLRRIVGRDSVIIKEVKKLDVGKGQFLFYNGSSVYDFNCPKYDSKGQKPIVWEPDIKQVPIWRYREGRRII